MSGPINLPKRRRARFIFLTCQLNNELLVLFLRSCCSFQQVGNHHYCGMFSGISPTMYPLNLMKFHPETFAGFRPLMPGALPGMLPPRPEPPGPPGPLGLVPCPPTLQPPTPSSADDKASVKSGKSVGTALWNLLYTFYSFHWNIS